MREYLKLKGIIKDLQDKVLYLATTNGENACYKDIMEANQDLAISRFEEIKRLNKDKDSLQAKLMYAEEEVKEHRKLKKDWEAQSEEVSELKDEIHALKTDKQSLKDAETIVTLQLDMKKAEARVAREQEDNRWVLKQKNELEGTVLALRKEAIESATAFQKALSEVNETSITNTTKLLTSVQSVLKEVKVTDPASTTNIVAQ